MERRKHQETNEVQNSFIRRGFEITYEYTRQWNLRSYRLQHECDCLSSRAIRLTVQYLLLRSHAVHLKQTKKYWKLIFALYATERYIIRTRYIPLAHLNVPFSTRTLNPPRADDETRNLLPPKKRNELLLQLLMRTHPRETSAFTCSTHRALAHLPLYTLDVNFHTFKNAPLKVVPFYFQPRKLPTYVRSPVAAYGHDHRTIRLPR